jgi:hypothetical protein
VLRKIIQKIKTLFHIHQTLLDIHQTLLNIESVQLMNEVRNRNPKTLLQHGFKAYSQFDEDGIIQEIFKRIGTTNKTFVEFGVGNGLENNSVYLLALKWRGLWIDANTTNNNFIRENLVNSIKNKKIVLKESFITKDNIDGLIKDYLQSIDINEPVYDLDLLSIDIDGNDVEVFKAISCVRPRVVVIEYNAKFAPPADLEFKYDPAHFWKGNDFHNSSLTATNRVLMSKGYSLVCCNLTGANAFFGRNDLVNQTLFPFDYTPETHWQPARYNLVQMKSGHPSSFDFIES